MPDFINSLMTVTWLEGFAALATAICVYLAVKRNILTYPIGIAGTTAYFFVFWGAELYSSAVLQIVFFATQVYGWWFWLYGDKGFKPRISRTNLNWLLAGACATVGGAFTLGAITGAFGAQLATLDAVIFSASLVAQFFMDRKKLESWLVWIVVNIVSIVVYGSMGLALTTILYAVLLVNAFFGYSAWRKEFLGYAKADAVPIPDVMPLPEGATLGDAVSIATGEPVEPVAVKAPRKRAPRKPKVSEV